MSVKGKRRHTQDSSKLKVSCGIYIQLLFFFLSSLIFFFSFYYSAFLLFMRYRLKRFFNSLSRSVVSMHMKPVHPPKVYLLNDVGNITRAECREYFSQFSGTYTQETCYRCQPTRMLLFLRNLRSLEIHNPNLIMEKKLWFKNKIKINNSSTLFFNILRTREFSRKKLVLYIQLLSSFFSCRPVQSLRVDTLSDPEKNSFKLIGLTRGEDKLPLGECFIKC